MGGDKEYQAWPDEALLNGLNEERVTILSSADCLFDHLIIPGTDVVINRNRKCAKDALV